MSVERLIYDCARDIAWMWMRRAYVVGFVSGVLTSIFVVWVTRHG